MATKNRHFKLNACLLCLALAPVALAHTQEHTMDHSAESKAPMAAHSMGPAEQTDWGVAGQPAQVQRTVNIRMGDNMRFTPDQLQIKLGQTVRFVVVNAGKQLHEIVLGTPAALKSHAEMMKKHPGMVHDQPDMAHVSPGQKGEIVWTFNRAGQFDFACLIPGHFDAGMVGHITVK